MVEVIDVRQKTVGGTGRAVIIVGRRSFYLERLVREVNPVVV